MITVSDRPAVVARWGRLIPAACLTATALLFATAAEATPAYARRYNVACQTCHAPLPPRLNNVGILFRKLGFRMPDADDQGRFIIKAVPAHDIGEAASIVANVAGRHGAGGVGGVFNANAQTGGMINGLRFVAETYTKEQLAKRIMDGVPSVLKANPNGPAPPLSMPVYRGLIGFGEMGELVDYLYSLKPADAKVKPVAW